MGSIETEQNPQSPTSLFSLHDCLYCREETCWDEQIHSRAPVLSSQFDVSSPEEDEEHLLALFSKEEMIAHSRMEFVVDRTETLNWMKRVSAHHDFGVNVVVLGANYFDRFVSDFGFRSDWLPWMIQLAAIACLSLASKVEETTVPPLLDFQVESKYNFEAKTIQKMELLVLSTLEWKMNAVTPLSFSGYLIKSLNLKTHLHWELLSRFESLILSAILDSRYLLYRPSVIAAATMVQALKELEISINPVEDRIKLMDMFKIRQDKAEECYKFMQEMSSNNNTTLKRKYISSLLPSLEPQPKKTKFNCLGNILNYK